MGLSEVSLTLLILKRFKKGPKVTMVKRLSIICEGIVGGGGGGGGNDKFQKVNNNGSR